MYSTYGVHSTPGVWLLKRVGEKAPNNSIPVRTSYIRNLSLALNGVRRQAFSANSDYSYSQIAPRRFYSYSSCVTGKVSQIAGCVRRAVCVLLLYSYHTYVWSTRGTIEM